VQVVEEIGPILSHARRLQIEGRVLSESATSQLQPELFAQPERARPFVYLIGGARGKTLLEISADELARLPHGGVASVLSQVSLIGAPPPQLSRVSRSSSVSSAVAHHRIIRKLTGLGCGLTLETFLRRACPELRRQVGWLPSTS
jgi:hypothetical protein